VYLPESDCQPSVVLYAPFVPKLWNDTIEAHRAAVRDATLDTAAALVGKHGLRSVTMSEIAEQTGIGRATLYKYFPDVEAILFAWHEREIGGHLAQLADARDQATDAGRRLEAVLEAYALISQASHGHHDAELAASLHRDEHVARAEQQLHGMIRDLLVETAAAGAVRDDIVADELATFCLHALAAASTLPSKAAVRRLVTVTLAGLRPPG
jgi:AcrR family transcriptional regulator